MAEPTFLIAGGQRCGTTALYRLLDQHPEIFLAKPERPEPKFFVNVPGPGRNRQWYVDTYFADVGGARAAGEKSTSYLECPEAPARIAAMFPAMRIVLLLRHPAERALSNYRFSVKHGLETLPFLEAVRNEDQRLREAAFPGISGHPFAYLRRGQYSEHLEHYARCFAPEKLKIVLTDDLESDPQAVCRQIFEFLAVDRSYRPSELQERVNASVPSELRISQEAVDFLLDHFRPWNLRLAEMIGRDLQSWNRPSPMIRALMAS